MKLKTVALGVAAAGLVAAEAVNLYKQVMGRGDRPKRPMTRLMEMKDKDDYAMADAWRQKYTDWVNTQPVATVSFAATMWAPVPPVASMWALITTRAKICSAGSST